MNVYWLEQTEQDVPASNDWLHPNEAARLGEMHFAKRRNDWRLGRWTAKRALAAHWNLCLVALPNIEIRAASSGAPEVFMEGESATITISISHRAGRAMCAFGPAHAALGCDLEIVEPRAATFVADYFTEEEQALVAMAPTQIATVIWSAKESALKALREGLRLDTKTVIVTLAAAPDVESVWHSLQVDHTAGRTFHGWCQRTGDIVRTLVADPPPASPILLP